MTKKARGVYYTPKPVVDYIVCSTLSPLLEGKSPMQLAGRKSNWEQDRDSHPFTILDPACGSGFFLLGAYQFLLDWCLHCPPVPPRITVSTHKKVRSILEKMGRRYS